MEYRVFIWTDLSLEKRCRGKRCIFEKFLLIIRERERENQNSHGEMVVTIFHSWGLFYNGLGGCVKP
jgi:hypothetical protein